MPIRQDCDSPAIPKNPGSISRLTTRCETGLILILTFVDPVRSSRLRCGVDTYAPPTLTTYSAQRIYPIHTWTTAMGEIIWLESSAASLIDHVTPT